MGFLDTILLQPILNVLLALTQVLFGSFGLGIIALTFIVRLIIFPLTLYQLRSSKKMTETMNALKPKLEQIKKKYAKNPQKLNQETMKLYKEAGISPLGCLSSPMLVTLIIQFPIFIAVYRAIVQGLAATPQDFLGLSQNLYSWSIVNQGLPISEQFLWLSLSKPDPYFIIPILTAATMWISQKMITQPTTDPQQQSMNSMMQIIMPLMFAFITLTLPSGLGLYFVVTNIFSIIVQYFVYGWGNLFTKGTPAAAGAKKPERSEKADKTDKIDKTVADSKDTREAPEADKKPEGPSGLSGLLDRFKPKKTDDKKR